jgi:hypothetical protein
MTLLPFALKTVFEEKLPDPNGLLTHPDKRSLLFLPLSWAFLATL